jgi:hypothetical protein
MKIIQQCRQSPRHASFRVIVINNNGNASDKYHLLKFSYDQYTEGLFGTIVSVQCCLTNAIIHE